MYWCPFNERIPIILYMYARLDHCLIIFALQGSLNDCVVSELINLSFAKVVLNDCKVNGFGINASTPATNACWIVSASEFADTPMMYW